MGLYQLAIMETWDLIYPLAVNKKTRQNIRNYIVRQWTVGGGQSRIVIT